MFFFFFFKQKTAYEMRISDWSSDVCSSDLGGLTMVLPSQPSLSWDLGETRGTVAVRMPAHHITLELLEETGPLAVSSANRTGMTAARSEERRVGKECVSTCRSRGAPYHSKTKKTKRLQTKGKVK